MNLPLARPSSLLVILLCTLLGCAHHDGTTGSMAPEDKPIDVESKVSETGVDRLAQELGIKIVSVRLTAGGHMVDLRYRVVNQETFAALIKGRSTLDIRIVDPVTKRILTVAETDLGKLRSKIAKPRKERVYFTLFDNPGEVIKQGSEITIIVNQIRLEGWRGE